MSELTAKEIQKAITTQKAKWKAKDHAFLRLSDAERARRLGVLLDERRLAELRTLPKPDMARVVAEFKGLRLSHGLASERGRGPDSGMAGAKADEFPFSLDETVLNAIRKLLLLHPRLVDWRQRKGRNNVTSVKDQGGCGSCVAFGTTASLESMVLIEHDVSLDLSEAELLFCGGGSCGGWWPDSAVTYLLNYGIAHETCFPYADHNMPCTHCGERDGEAVQITSNIVIFDLAQRKQYLAQVGPVMCVFEVYGDFFGYSQGVYSHTMGGFAGLHCVEVIGYDDLHGCWICKNSWGASWGDHGFFQISYGQCGIDSTYPFWGVSGTRWYT